MGRNYVEAWKFLLKYVLKWKCNVWSLLKKVFGRIYCEILEIFLEHFLTPLHFLKHRYLVEYLDQFKRGKKLSHPILLHILFNMGMKKGLVIWLWQVLGPKTSKRKRASRGAFNPIIHLTFARCTAILVCRPLGK